MREILSTALLWVQPFYAFPKWCNEIFFFFSCPPTDYKIGGLKWSPNFLQDFKFFMSWEGERMFFKTAQNIIILITLRLYAIIYQNVFLNFLRREDCLCFLLSRYLNKAVYLFHLSCLFNIKNVLSSN